MKLAAFGDKFCAAFENLMTQFCVKGQPNGKGHPYETFDYNNEFYLITLTSERKCFSCTLKIEKKVIRIKGAKGDVL